ncbi:DinB family protein [Spongiimicrobium sp. 3-5]|uniref:DinB family protein n=1 Tax=Spongiimicrobium sp. 3-5 TaxID=3332596 RepID=UPI00397F8287
MRKSELKDLGEKPFYNTYLNVLGDVDLMETLKNGKDNFVKLIEETPDEKLKYAYNEGKWTLAEVISHIIDAERVFQFRAFRFSRNDTTPLPGFEQDGYVLESNANEKSKEELLKEYVQVRNCSITLFGEMDDAKLSREGVASNLKWSVAGLGFVICGHQEHHVQILKERYLA